MSNHVPRALHNRIIAFFDAAKDLALDLALEISGRSAFVLPEFDEVLKIHVKASDPEVMRIELRPKRHAMLMAAICWTGPLNYSITSILPTLPDPGGAPIERLFPDSDGIDTNFFANGDDPCPFDFGMADTEHPIILVVKRISKSGDAELDMSVFAKYMPVVSVGSSAEAH